MARQKQVAVLYAGLKVRDTGFAAGLRKAKNDAMRELRAIGGALSGPMGLLGIGGGVAGFTALGVQMGQAFRAGLERADRYGKQADRLGMMTDEYTGLSFAARQADVDQEQFAEGMSRMMVNVRQAAAGNKALREQFQGLGVDVDNLSRLNASEQLFAIADAYGRIGSVAGKLDFARTIFGRGNAAGFMAMLGDGRESILAALQDAQALGLVLSDLDAAKADAANDAMLRTRDILEGFWDQLSVKAAPALTQVNDLLADLVKAMGGVERVADEVIEKFAMWDIAINAGAGWLRGQAGAIGRTANVIVGPDPRDTYAGRNYISSFVNAGGLRALVDSGYRQRLGGAFFSATPYGTALANAMGSGMNRWYGGADPEVAQRQQDRQAANAEGLLDEVLKQQERVKDFWTDYWEMYRNQLQTRWTQEQKAADVMEKVLRRQQALYEEHNQVLADRAMMAQEALVGTPVSSLSPFVTGRAMMARFAQFSAADAATIGSGPPPQVRELKEIKSTLERFKEDAVRELTKLVGLPNAANGVQIALPVGG